MSDTRLDRLEQRIERLEKYTGIPFWWDPVAMPAGGPGTTGTTT